MAKEPTQPAAAKAGRKPGVPTVAPELTAVSAAVPMPTPPARGNRGRGSNYPFDELEPGQSFGVKNKTLKQMSSIISNQNKKARVNKTDDNGNVIYKTTTAKDANGNVQTLPTDKPETIATKVFFGVECDPKADPDGAAVRVFRQS